MGQGPGPAAGSWQQGEQVHEQQNTLQPHGPGCAYQRKTGQGQEAELLEPAECGYVQSRDNGYQGLPCRWEGQPTTSGHRKTLKRSFMATRFDV